MTIRVPSSSSLSRVGTKVTTTRDHDVTLARERRDLTTHNECAFSYHIRCIARHRVRCAPHDAMKPLTRRAVEVTARASSPSPSAPSTPSDAARRRASNAASSSVVARRRAATEKSPPLSSSSSSSLSTLDAPSSRAREELTHRAARTASKRARGDDEREDDARLKLARRSRARHARETAQARGVTVRSLGDVARRDAGAGAGAASCALTPPVTPFAGSASGREARTRRETALRARREANEAASGLLGTLCEDALWMVCSRLSALDLVALEQTSAYFRESARVKDRGLGLCERIAHERVRGVPMVGMPPFYRYVGRSTGGRASEPPVGVPSFDSQCRVIVFALAFTRYTGKRHGSKNYAS